MSQSRAGRTPRRGLATAAGPAPARSDDRPDSQTRSTVACQTRLVTSLTPRSRLLVSGLVLPALARWVSLTGAVPQQVSGVPQFRRSRRRLAAVLDGKAPGVGAAAAQAPKVRGSSPRISEVHDPADVSLSGSRLVSGPGAAPGTGTSSCRGRRAGGVPDGAHTRVVGLLSEIPAPLTAVRC